MVQSTGELREVRACLTERSTVFGVTLLYREGKFSKPERGMKDVGFNVQFN